MLELTDALEKMQLFQSVTELPTGTPISPAPGDNEVILPGILSSGNDNRLQNHNLIPFEFSLPVQEVLGHLIPIIPKKEHKEDQMWFSGILDKYTGKAISATIGRRTSLEGDIMDDSDSSL